MAFIGMPPIIDVEYDRRGTPGHACNGCNSAWPVSEGDADPTHHDSRCSWFAALSEVCANCDGKRATYVDHPVFGVEVTPCPDCEDRP